MPYSKEAEKFVNSLDSRSVIEMPNNGSKYSKLLRLEESVRREYGRTLPNHIAYEHVIMDLPIHAIARGLAKYGFGSDPSAVSSIAKHFGIQINNVRKRKGVERPVDSQAMAQSSKNAVEKEPLWTSGDVDAAARKLLEPYIDHPNYRDYESVAAGMREGGVNHFSPQLARGIMNRMRKERGLDKKPEEKTLQDPKKETHQEKKNWNYFLHQLGDAESPFTTWSKLYFEGEHYYSVPETPVIMDTPKSVISHENLVIAIERASGCECKDAEDVADKVLQFVGFDGMVLQNRFNNAGEDENGRDMSKLFVDLFRKLEDMGLAYPYIIEDVNFRGWRSQYWILNERNIRKHVEESQKQRIEEKTEETPEETYAKLFAEGVQANGNGNHLK